MSHYLFLSSEGKAPFDFTTELNQPLTLDGQWEVGLTEIIRFPSSSGVYYFLSDLCECSFINSRLLPVLRRLFTSDSFLEERYHPILYFPLSKNRIDRVRIYIKDRDFQNSLDFKHPLYCTLHLRKR